jgi:hypothetical protein
MNENKNLKIQTNIVGFGGKPVSLLSLYIPSTGALMVSELKRHSKERLIDSIDVLITNEQGENHDSFFNEDDFQEAISAYFYLAGKTFGDAASSCLQFHKKVNNGCNPDSYIEQDGMDVNGWRYRVQEIPSSAVAVLATAMYVRKSQNISRTVDFAEEMAALVNDGFGVTI